MDAVHLMDPKAVEMLAPLLGLKEPFTMTKKDLQEFTGRSSATIDELIMRPGFPYDLKGSTMTFWKPAVAAWMYNNQRHS
ncbi:hypothetical protein [Lacticaseibacillus rhamnosus]|mgnify:FL=1|uniref:hypothetical protein n=1 Tax=Lacticaseibacillus rhamnosus TaxID=47715 RepID=UPI000629DE2F|nr:hypothetical protein [Lacticaseibacillus rhamnosus]KKW88332.1 hypothetical protein XA20_04670 [Lacticaseibacillus rhamnosus]MCZ2733616.1 hypothetical protein [Lacticaseibacillus rhamnosus]MCZ2736299.1 hypothetical protein [Lacticaseibacillus rhamnosus]MCZ2742627.1 hypothetical protein [Lacticaseibacillus rhamnosus]MCZ2745371.1 hypothetical protein [Lacticaseibacillus rhamnosus]